MRSEAVESYIRKLNSLVESLLFSQGHAKAGTRLVDDLEETWSYDQTKEGKELERQLIADLLGKQRWHQKFSVRRIKDFLSKVRSEFILHRTRDHIPTLFRQLVEEYESLTEEIEILVPLVGLRMKMDEYPIGNVVLRNLKGEKAEAVRERCRENMMRNEYYTDAQRQAWFKVFDEQYVSRVTDRVSAEYRVVAEEERARELAVEEIRKALDLLRYAALRVDKDDEKYVTRLGIQGEVSEDTRATVGFLGDGSKIHYTGEMVFRPFELDEWTLPLLEDLRIPALSDTLRQEKPTDFEETILNSVHWIASAQNQFEATNKILNLVTSFETLLKPAAGDPISATIAEGVAILTATGLDERRTRKRRVRYFYGLRSTLTHEGQGEITGKEVRELSGIAQTLIVKVLARKDEFKTQEDLRNWVDDQKLGGPAF